MSSIPEVVIAIPAIIAASAALTGWLIRTEHRQPFTPEYGTETFTRRTR